MSSILYVLCIAAFNAGLLQAPLFSPDLPAYVNYGALGYLAAHHLSHASQLQVCRFSSYIYATIN